MGKTEHADPAVLADIPWEGDPRGYFHRLLRLHPDEMGLTGVGGVYVLWHRGQHPRWIYVGATADLGEAIGAARDRRAVLEFEAYGCVYASWVAIKPEYRDGVALYLRSVLNCEIDEVFSTDHLDAEAEPIAVQPPK